MTELVISESYQIKYMALEVRETYIKIHHAKYAGNNICILQDLNHGQTLIDFVDEVATDLRRRERISADTIIIVTYPYYEDKDTFMVLMQWSRLELKYKLPQFKEVKGELLSLIVSQIPDEQYTEEANKERKESDSESKSRPKVNV